MTAAAHFIGVGSVGCGGVGDARARDQVLYVTDSDVVVGFRSVEYDLDSVARDMAANGLPRACCANRRSRTRWSIRGRSRSRPPRPPPRHKPAALASNPRSGCLRLPHVGLADRAGGMLRPTTPASTMSVTR